MWSGKTRPFTSADRLLQYDDDDSVDREQLFLLDTFGFLRMEVVLDDSQVAAANAAIDRHAADFDRSVLVGTLSRSWSSGLQYKCS